MSSPWKGELKYVVPANGVEGTTALSDPAWVPDCESVSLERREEIRARTNRISSHRVPDVDLQTVEHTYPGGDFVVHPRTDDLAPLLMGFFQAVCLTGTLLNGTFLGPGASGGGTLAFAPVEDQPDWEGSSWGTYQNGVDYSGAIVTGDVYPLWVYEQFSDEFAGNNYVIYRRAIASRLSFSQPYNEDLSLTTTIEALSKSEYDGEISNVGTMVSTKDILVDWKGTVSLDGSEIEAESVEINLDNTSEGIGALGNQNYKRFYFGRGDFGGSFEHEMNESIGSFVAGGTASLTARWQLSDSEWLQIEMPNIKYDPNTPSLSGDARTMRTIPFKAYASAGTPAVVIRLCTVMTEGTNGFDRSLATDWP